MLCVPRAFAIVAGTLLVAGCGLLPSAGPNSIAITSGVTFRGPEYGRVKLTNETVRDPRRLRSSFYLRVFW